MERQLRTITIQDPISPTLTYEIQWSVARPFKMYHAGKSWPLMTTCRVSTIDTSPESYSRGVKQLRAEDFAIKHHIDEDNPFYAQRLTLAKALKRSWYFAKPTRTFIMKEFNNHPENSTWKQKQ